MNMPSFGAAISIFAFFALSRPTAAKSRGAMLTSPRVSRVSIVPEKSTWLNGSSSLILSTALSTSYSEPKNVRAVMSTNMYPAELVIVYIPVRPRKSSRVQRSSQAPGAFSMWSVR